MQGSNCPCCSAGSPSPRKPCSRCGLPPRGFILQDKYRIESYIGRGGMGWICKGSNLQLNVPVAIKGLHKNLLTNQSVTQRFQREARLQARLGHPQIVRVTDWIDEPTCLGLVMDWIDGPNFHVWLSHQSSLLSRKDICRLFLPILDAFGFAHDKGVIHRDIKPQNILLTGPPGNEEPFITDFGVAKIFVQDQKEALTGIGAFMGTAAYMSPEQFDDAGRVDKLADIYSLGVLLFELVTGRLPFGPFGENSNVRWMFAHHHYPLPSVTLVNPKADRGFEPILRKAMAKQASERFESCEAFKDALLALLKEEVAYLPSLKSANNPTPYDSESDVILLEKVKWRPIPQMLSPGDTPDEMMPAQRVEACKTKDLRKESTPDELMPARSAWFQFRETVDMGQTVDSFSDAESARDFSKLANFFSEHEDELPKATLGFGHILQPPEDSAYLPLFEHTPQETKIREGSGRALLVYFIVVGLISCLLAGLYLFYFL